MSQADALRVLSRLVAQLNFAALRDAVPRGSFTGKRALVIGGARGLGELTAKLLAIGGADVSITYLNGADDTAAIVTDGSASGYCLQRLNFDVAAPPGDVQGSDDRFTRAYYFATRRIVTGLARSVAWLQSRSVENLRVWYPSSVFVEEVPPGFAEYATAKACGEALCAQMSARMSPVQVIADRLPRLATDQTQSLTTQTLEDSVAILRSILLRLA